MAPPIVTPPALNGYLILDKPLGLSSAQAVGAMKRTLRRLGVPKTNRIGHGGTLDPLASGVLPLALGEATKTVGYVLTGAKAYDFTVYWGVATDTLDAEGAVTATSDTRPTPAAIMAALPAFHGAISQLPPVYSALKVDGRRAYTLARAGEAVILQPRTVQIDRLALLDATPDSASFHLQCGKGTYVRALARDLAAAVGTVGHVTALRRTAAGPFRLDQAISLESLERIGHIQDLQTALLPLATALDDIPALAVTAGEAARLRFGQPLAVSPALGFSDGVPILVTCDGVSLALGDISAGILRSLRVFNL